jgi:hypothetical protein
MEMAAIDGEAEGCVVCVADVECGISPNDEKGNVQTDSSSYLYIISDFSTTLRHGYLANA